MDQSSDVPGREDQGTRMNVLLAEFNAIRAEILFRATAQATLIQINITAAGAIVGLVFGEKADPLILLIVPILSPVLGMLWLDHNSSIARLGQFVENEVKPKYQKVVAFDYPDYQAYMKTVAISKVLTLNFNVAIVISFLILPIAALAYAVLTVASANEWLFEGPALLSIVLLVLFFVQYALKFRRTE